MKNIPKGQALETIAKLEAAGLNRDLAHLIITVPNNELAKAMVKVALDYQAAKNEKKVPAEVDWSDHFEKIDSFKIVIPKNCSLSAFRDEYEDTFVKIDEDLTDENFMPSIDLVPGETKMVTIYRSIKKIKGIACLAFAASKGELPNAQGLSAMWMQNEDGLGRNLWYLGLDQPENLFEESSNQIMIPTIGHTVSGCVFDTVKLEEELSPGFCVVVFN